MHSLSGTRHGATAVTTVTTPPGESGTPVFSVVSSGAGSAKRRRVGQLAHCCIFIPGGIPRGVGFVFDLHPESGLLKGQHEV